MTLSQWQRDQIERRDHAEPGPPSRMPSSNANDIQTTDGRSPSCDPACIVPAKPHSGPCVTKQQVDAVTGRVLPPDDCPRCDMEPAVHCPEHDEWVPFDAGRVLSRIPTVRCTTCAAVMVVGLPHSCPPPRDDQGRVEPTTFYLGSDDADQ